MNTYLEIKNSFEKGLKIFWNDPDYIKGNNYQLSFLEDINEEVDGHTPILIQYNNGGSEAQVFLHELIIIESN